jgi:hypothetical protein
LGPKRLHLLLQGLDASAIGVAIHRTRLTLGVDA